MSLHLDNRTEAKSLKDQIEERVKYFIKNQNQITSKKKNLKRAKKDDIYSTIIDSININNDVKFPSINSRNNNDIKEKLNESTQSTQTKNMITEIPIKASISIPISKDLIKYGEPKYKKKTFSKLPQKFSVSSNDTNPTSNATEENEIGNSKERPRHRYTDSELEILETDEKVPQEEIEKITNSNLSNLFPNKEDIYSNNNILYIFHFVSNIEKCYQELSKDLKGNGLKNIDYKVGVANTYLSIMMDENNLLGNFFLNNEDDINEFLIRELCLFLSILFFDCFANGLNESHIREFSICFNYCHINLLYVILLIIKKCEENINEYKIKFKENSLEYNDFQKCKSLIISNSDKININKYKETFHTNNKIIKNIFLNLLNILSDINENITKTILSIFNMAKTSKFRDIMNNYIKPNYLIKEKINEILKKQEYSEEIIIQEKNNINKINNSDNKNDYKADDEINEQFIKNEYIVQEVTEPFLPPKKIDDKRDYCLVLDLDETLVHFCEDNNEAYVKVRMGAEHFITVLSQYCEIVIFTASTKYYCDIVIDGLDCKNLIDYKLYREYTQDYNGINVKDLSKLGRDLTKIIIIDNIEDNYTFQPNNGLNIIDFEGDENDNELQYLLMDLLEVVSEPGKNVLNELPKIRENMQKRYSNII
jgi:TFIIF-interacting CTD phosphatase-like protein